MSTLSPSLVRRRRALFAFFFLPGMAMATWVTRTPAIRDALQVNIAEMGMVLFGLSVGSMTGIIFASKFVKRFGTSKVALVGLTWVVLALLTIALGVAAGEAVVVALGLGFFGLGMGMAEIAINIDGADLERLAKKAILHALHGFFSLGTVVGAAIGIAFTAVDFPVVWHLSAVAALCVAIIFFFAGSIPAGLGVAVRGDGAARGTRHAQPLWRDVGLLLIGFVVLGIALAEGAANDWLPLLMVDGYGIGSTGGSLVFLGFAVAMTAGRLGGGFFLERFGRPKVILASALMAGVGLSLVVFGQSPVVAGMAVVLWGLGSSLGFPVALSAAGDSGSDPTERVRLVSMAGYVAFLVGPPLLGFIGEHYGLRNAMIVVLIMLGGVALASSALGERRDGLTQRFVAGRASGSERREKEPGHT